MKADNPASFAPVSMFGGSGETVRVSDLVADAMNTLR
jgi:hypothetical protein